MAKEMTLKPIHDETLSQLIILAFLEKIEIAVSERSLQELCTAEKGIPLDYIDYRNALDNLLNFKFVNEIKSNTNDIKIKISEKGIQGVGLYYYDIPKTVREEIIRICNEKKLDLKIGQEYKSVYTKNTDGTYTCIFKIISPNEDRVIFELSMLYPSRELAIMATSKWKEKASEIYSTIFESLGE